MEQSKEGDKLFNDLTNQDHGHSLRPRRSTRRSKENLDGGTGTVTGKVVGAKYKFMAVAASPDAFLASGSSERPGTSGRQPRSKRVNQRQVGGGAGNLGGAKLQQIGLGGEGDNAHQQQGGGGGDLQVKVEDEEVALVGVVREEADDLEVASRKLRLLKKRRVQLEARLQVYADKIVAQTQIVKDLAGQL